MVMWCGWCGGDGWIVDGQVASSQQQQQQQQQQHQQDIKCAGCRNMPSLSFEKWLTVVTMQDSETWACM
jgi:hypothetical protein